MAARVSHFSFLFTICCILCAHVDSKPLRRHQKRNSNSQNDLRRCGNDDFDSTTQLSTEYKYLPDTDAPRLPKRSLSWKITQYPVEIDNHTTVESVHSATWQALNLWSSVANLEFHHIYFGTPDIEIKFQIPKTHNRQCVGAFSTGIIAHYVSGSKSPGRIHFNEQHEWTTTRFDTRNRSINLVSAIAHEVGHLLGFGHTTVSNSIMYRYYTNNVITAPIVLSADDILAATNRYGVTIHLDPTTFGPTDILMTTATSTSTLSSPGNIGRYGCNEAPTKTFSEVRDILHPVCATLYDLDNCRGPYITTPIHVEYYKLTDLHVFNGHWENRISSLVVAPNCRIRVCSVADGTRICSANLTGQIPNLDIQFDNQIDKVSCSCDVCSVPFPITEPNMNICGVAYQDYYCRSEPILMWPGVAFVRRAFKSAQVNPNCTVEFVAHNYDDGPSTSITFTGGVNGTNYLFLGRGYNEARCK